jgi:hypothetical protein
MNWRTRCASQTIRFLAATCGGLDYFLNTVFNYSTLAECYKVAAYNAANKINCVRRTKALPKKHAPAKMAATAA